MTQDAATLVQTLTGGGGDAGGIRIVVNDSTNSLSMSLVAGAEHDDSVVTNGGATVYLSASASRRMHDQLLCAEIDPLRSLFFLRPA
jgi:Fe-S cluster assembly iron-binding protein IscA